MMRSLTMCVAALSAVIVSLPSCEGAPAAPVRVNTPGEVALAFRTAAQRLDFATVQQFAGPGARDYFAAEAEFFGLMLERPEPEAVATARVLGVEESADDSAIVTLEETVEGKDGPSSRPRFLHLRREGVMWGVVGFSASRDEAAMMFEDRLADVQLRLAQAREETTPHSELGPVVEAYLEAAAAKNREGMTALMLAECIEEQFASRNTFSNGFLGGEYRVQKWQFARHEIDGDGATQRIRTILELENGETDGEPMAFGFTRLPEGWKIASIR